MNLRAKVYQWVWSHLQPVHKHIENWWWFTFCCNYEVGFSLVMMSPKISCVPQSRVFFRKCNTARRIALNSQTQGEPVKRPQGDWIPMNLSKALIRLKKIAEIDPLRFSDLRSVIQDHLGLDFYIQGKYAGKEAFFLCSTKRSKWTKDPCFTYVPNILFTQQNIGYISWMSGIQVEKISALLE